jgi:hypothetical protein
MWLWSAKSQRSKGTLTVGSDTHCFIENVIDSFLDHPAAKITALWVCKCVAAKTMSKSVYRTAEIPAKAILEICEPDSHSVFRGYELVAAAPPM